MGNNIAKTKPGRKLAGFALKKYSNKFPMLYNYDFNSARKDDLVAPLFVQKLMGCEPATMRDEVAFDYYKQFLECRYPTRDEMILYAIAFCGGLYSYQVNYLGLFNPTENNLCMRRLYSACTKDCNAYSVGNFLQRNKLPLLTGDTATFYDFNKDACSDISDELSQLGVRIPYSLRSKKSTSLEHSAGVNDLLCYILGNDNYPPTFTFESEEMLSFMNSLGVYEHHIIPDAICETRVSSRTDDVTVDYIEVHTGTQRASVIADKLRSYTAQLYNSSTLLSGKLLGDSILFLIHPGGSVGAVEDEVSVDSLNKDEVIALTALAGLVFSKGRMASIAELGSYLDLEAGSGYAGLREGYGSYFSHTLNSQMCRKLHLLVEGIIKTRADAGLSAVLSELICEIVDFNGTLDTGSSYDNYYGIYNTQSNLILSNATEIFKRDYQDIYEHFVQLCFGGLSLTTVFGADMHGTYLFTHPHYTGVSANVVNMLDRCGVLSNSAGCFSRGVPNVLVGAKYYIENSQGRDFPILLRNAVTYYSNEHEDMSNICMEYLSKDYGSRIRVSRVLSCDTLQGQLLKLVLLVDDIRDAFTFVASDCVHLLYSGRTENLFVGGNTDVAIGARRAIKILLPDTFSVPVFITKSDYVAFTEGGPARLYVLKGFSLFAPIKDKYAGLNDPVALAELLKNELIGVVENASTDELLKDMICIDG